MRFQIEKFNFKHFYCTYIWKNDRQTISGSVSGRGVSVFEHLKWCITKILSRKNFFGYIFLDEYNSKVAFVFFSRIAQNDLEISINLNPNFRGKRMSSKIIKSAIDWLNTQNNFNFYAFVKLSNIKSEKSFMGAGFKLTKHPYKKGCQTFVLRSTI